MKTIKLSILLLVLSCFVNQNMYAQDVVYNDIDRTDWVAQAPPYSPTDVAVGNDVADAKYLIDGNPKTFLALVKPGKAFGSPLVTGPTTIEELGFTIDMGSSLKFNYFKIDFRSDNSYDYLRPWEISIYGSNGTEVDPDDRDWTLITDRSGNDKIVLPNAEGNGQNKATGPVELDNATAYSSVKVVYTAMSPSASGSTLQVGEFYLGSVSYDKVIDKPADIAFGDVMQAASTTKELVVKGANITSEITYQLGGADATAFSVTPGAWTSTGGAATITFSPTAKKAYNATLTINSTGILEAQTINLTGNADFELPVQISEGSNNYWYYVQFERQAKAGTVLTMEDPAQENEIIKQSALDVENDNQLWKITGTWDNYSLVNKSNKTIAFVNIPVSEDPLTGEQTPEMNVYVSKNAGTGDSFGFVRYLTTESWQLKNMTSEKAAELNRLYLNDLSGENVTGFTLNNPGNQLKFIDAETAGFVVAGDTVNIGNVNQHTTEDLSVLVGGVKLTSSITVAITKDEDNVFTLKTTTLPAEGGQIDISFAPTAYKKVSFATISLSSGSTQLSFVVSASSDVGISKYYVGTAEQWGSPADGERVDAIPTPLSAGDKVWIAEGEYSVPQIGVPANVEICGGFAGNETSLEQRLTGAKPWEFTHPTVLKNTAALVLSITGVNTLVDGITFEGTEVNGRAIQNTTSSAKGGIIRNSIMKKFNSKADGGAFNIRYETEIYNCLITENTGNKGGAGYCDNLVIHDCEITNNSVPVDAPKAIGNINGGGGGLLLATEGNGNRAYNLYVSGNTASFGGGVYMRSRSMLYNSVIVNNTAQKSGSGIAFDERDNLGLVYNVTIANNNSVEAEGAGVCFTAGATDRTQVLYNTILYNNTDSYTEIYNIGVFESGVGKAIPEIKNIIIDDLEYYAGVNANLAITEGIAEDNKANLFVGDTWVTNTTVSPGKDKGLYQLTEEIVDEETADVIPATYLEFASGKDMAGGQRVVGIIDIGPYEDQVGSGIENIQSDLKGRIVETQYFNLQGVQVMKPVEGGVYIKREILDTNKVRTSKILIVNQENKY